MSFKYESEMTELVRNWLRAQGLHVKSEYPTPWGICDLVGCSLNKLSVRKRLHLGQKRPIGSQFRILLLSHIPDIEEDKAVSASQLYRPFAGLLDESFVANELRKLKQDRFVHEARPGMFQKLNGWVPMHKRIVAVELKLTRISEVISQALSNLEFADESYVGLPYESARQLFIDRAKRKLAERGVGIIGVTPTGAKVLLKSKSDGRSNPILAMHCAERFWRTYSKGT